MVKASVSAVCLATFVGFLPSVSGVYFKVSEGQEKCFVDDSHLHQVLTVTTKQVENPGVECMLVLKEPAGAEVLSKRLDPSSSEDEKVAYAIQSNGKHHICIRCPSGPPGTYLKWELRVDRGNNVLDAATTDHFDDAEKALWSATARADAISAEIEYENSTEGEFSSAMERLGSRTISTSILVVFVELLLCVWQVSHLWSFFKREKLE